MLVIRIAECATWGKQVKGRECYTSSSTCQHIGSFLDRQGKAIALDVSFVWD